MHDELFTALPPPFASPQSAVGTSLLRDVRENGSSPPDSFLDATRRIEMTHYFRATAMKQEGNAVPRLPPFTAALV